MRPGATLMSAFLFNIGLVLLAVSASILFCAQAFSLYANSTAIQEIFGNQVQSDALNHGCRALPLMIKLVTSGALSMHDQYAAFPSCESQSSLDSLLLGDLQMLSLQGIKYLYTTHVFIYCMFGFVGLTIVYLAVRGPDRWKRRKLEDVYADG